MTKHFGVARKPNRKDGVPRAGRGLPISGKRAPLAAFFLIAADSGHPPTPGDIWQTWSVEPLLLASLLAMVAFYARGISIVWRRAGVGRGVSNAQVAAFAAAILILLLALVSPLDALSGALLAAHMVQHLLLMLIVAPLLVIGASPAALAWAVPRSRHIARWWHRRRLLRRAWHTLSHPALVWLLNLLVLWLWHLPQLYGAALSNEAIHALEHASFLTAALLFWYVLLRSGALSVGAAVLFVFSTALHGGLLAALLTFAARPWYASYTATTVAWGLTPLEDQQLAGVIMWFPGGLVYLAAALLLLGSWLHRREVQEGNGGRVVRPPRQQTAEVKT